MEISCVVISSEILHAMLALMLSWGLDAVQVRMANISLDVNNESVNICDPLWENRAWWNLR